MLNWIVITVILVWHTGIFVLKFVMQQWKTPVTRLNGKFLISI